MSAISIPISPKHMDEFRQCHPILQEIFCWVALECWPVADLYVTSIHRTIAENIAAGAKTEIHCTPPPYRAIDIRVLNLSDPQKAADEIGARVNARWIYDPARPEKVVAYTESHGTGPHVHLQVFSNTQLRT